MDARLQQIYVAVDGSGPSDGAMAAAAALARAFGGRVTGVHAYAARMHDKRFRQMEGGLPEPFRAEEELKRQRDVHATLIERGLKLISESYLHAASQTDVPFEARCVEGRNYRALVDDIERAAPDLVVLGASGLGVVEGGGAGSVCTRVLRRIGVDALVVRDGSDPFARIGVALDGSPESLGALQAALLIVQATGAPLYLMSSFDPHFHHVVFHRIADVLTEEAGAVFDFEAQEQLHEQIIDAGLARIYKGHLDVGQRVAEEAGVAVAGAELRTGKAHVCVARFAEEHALGTLFVGRVGVHSDGDLELGSVPEVLLRAPLPANLYLAATRADPERYRRHEPPLAWTDEATQILRRAPAFVQPMITGAVERIARDRGHTVVTSDLMAEVSDRAHAHRAAAAEEGPYERELFWEALALARLHALPEPAQDAVAREVERRARRRGIERITAELLAEAHGARSPRT